MNGADKPRPASFYAVDRSRIKFSQPRSAPSGLHLRVGYTLATWVHARLHRRACLRTMATRGARLSGAPIRLSGLPNEFYKSLTEINRFGRRSNNTTAALAEQIAKIGRNWLASPRSSFVQTSSRRHRAYARIAKISSYGDG